MGRKEMELWETPYVHRTVFRIPAPLTTASQIPHPDPPSPTTMLDRGSGGGAPGAQLELGQQ